MPVTNYYTIDGQMVGYKDAGGRKDFLTDALGSVTAEIDQTCAKTFDGRYKPYGGDLTTTGTRGKYGWIGSWGYRETGLSASSHYVRARHYSKTSGNWTTVDRLWPSEPTYSYVTNRIVSVADPSGLAPCSDPDPCRDCDCQAVRKLTGAESIEGLVGCCKGKVFGCGAIYKGVGGLERYQKCADAHENDHVKYCNKYPGACKCSSDSGCGRQTFKPGNAGNDSECRAFGVQIRCMAGFTKPKVCDNVNSIGCRLVKLQCKYLLGVDPYGELGLLKCKPDPDVLKFCNSIGIFSP